MNEKVERRWTIWVCPASETGPWRVLAAYRNLDGPFPIEVMPVEDYQHDLQAAQERERGLREALERIARDFPDSPLQRRCATALINYSKEEGDGDH